MTRYRDIKGLSVITLAEGKKVGQVDLIVDPDARAVRWLRVSGGGGGLLGGRTALWAPASAVHSVGEHAVTISSEADLEKSEEVPQAAEMARSGRALLGKKVLSEGGRYMGEARDFSFAPEDFTLTSIAVAEGNALSPQITEIDAGSLRTIGEDVIVVSDDLETASPGPSLNANDAMPPQEQDPAGSGWTDVPARRPARDEVAGNRPETGRPAAGDPGTGRSGNAQVYDSSDLR